MLVALLMAEEKKFHLVPCGWPIVSPGNQKPQHCKAVTVEPLSEALNSLHQVALYHESVL